ncbi:hypothetical protein [Pseudomonas aegrilactucae]|uniref:Uncharacterized protein n=1 Tax=Pseudomonas aegrilactucae TaxID=2854028 RepID=A0A9Q2XEF0_9PSED|nr:hypothetical protein [Pseudomonas aegrilactucae]MBV6285952.1 hypothetical protein [Pseudomonas aegrilactucae]
MAPLLTGAAVGLTIASQLLFLVSFLLPLKVILLLGRETIPSYFPDFMVAFGRERLIVVLSVASVLFYFSHLVCDRMVTRFSDRGAEKLVQRSRKIAIFERQDEVASKGYLRFSQAFAGLCFTGVCLFGMLFFYTKLAFLILVYFLVFSIVVALLSAGSEVVRDKLADGLGTLPKLMASLGFLITFSFIVVDHLYLEPVGVLVSVVSLLLSRQLFSKAANVLKDTAELYQQQGMLRALFFHAHVFLPEKKASGFAGLAERAGRDKWMLESLTSVMDTQHVKFSSRWVSIGAPDLLCFVADVAAGEGGGRQILFKIFDVNRSAQALHEASLLTQQRALPAPAFLGATTVAGMNCHLFEITGYNVFVPDDENSWRDRLVEFREHSLALVPAPALVSSYLRSRVQLVGRLNVQSLDYLSHLYEGERDLEPLVRLRELLPAIIQILGELPLAFHLPDIRPNMIWLDADGNSRLLHWGRWALEPVGFNWPQNAEMIEPALTLLQTRRHELSDLSLNKTLLAALCSGFEDNYRKGHYDKAYRLVLAILPVYAECRRGEV